MGNEDIGPQEDWTYVGHGEWTPQEQNGSNEEGDVAKLAWEPEWVHKWLCSVDQDMEQHVKVLQQGYPNRWGARIPVPSKWDLDKLDERLQDYEDKEVVEWLRYGWPTGRLPTLPEPITSCKNHKGASEHPEAMKKYIMKEISKGAVMGPYKKIPFTRKVGISPLSSRPKRDSKERRVILDLSFPFGGSVNKGIPKDTYLGLEAKLEFPKVDDFAFIIFSLRRGCGMFKVDLSRYFRQLPLDPGDYSLIGYVIDGDIYFDKVLPMGMRSAPYIAQRVTNTIAYIHRKLKFFLLNYVDDFIGAETKQMIWAAYQALTALLAELRVDISQEKLVPPTTRLEFLGITFDSNTKTI